jgi:hypothetical protein
MMPDSSRRLNIDLQTRMFSHLNGNPSFGELGAWWYLRTDHVSQGETYIISQWRVQAVLFLVTDGTNMTKTDL